MGPEVFSAGAVISAACVSGFVMWHTSKDNTKVKHFQTLLEGYNTIVINLQNEMARLQTEIANMKSSMEDCESRSFALQAEIEALRDQVTDLGAQPIASPAPRKRTAKTTTARSTKKS